MDEVDSPNLKAIVDTGDFFWQGQDPAEAIAVLYPKVIRVQLNELLEPSRDLKNRDYTRQHPKKEHRPFGQGEMDFRSIIAKLKELGYESYLTLEIEQRGSYLNPELGADVRQSAEYISEILESTRAAAK